MTAQRLEEDARKREEAPARVARLLRVAWLAILLGLAMEVLLLAASGMGNVLGSTVLADLVKNVSWSVIVCVGLALGSAVGRAATDSGLAGLLAAPLAFEASRAMHKGTLEALAATGAASASEPSPFVIAALKGLEYGCLGLLIAWVGGRPWGGAVAHVAVGLAVGVVFGGAILAFVHAADPTLPANVLLPRAANEILFPVGCSLVLFSARALGERVAQDKT